MKVEKFSEFKNDYSKTKIDNIEPIVNSIEKGYKFKFASKSVFCFGKDNKSILLFEQDSHLNIQAMFEKTNMLSSIGGYNIYKVNKKLENPFFNDNNQYLESHFYFRDNDYFKKIKYFISKIMSVAEELDIYPELKWDSNRIVEVKIYSHKSSIITEKQIELSKRISQIWYNIS